MKIQKKNEKCGGGGRFGGWGCGSEGGSSGGGVRVDVDE